MARSATAKKKRRGEASRPKSRKKAPTKPVSKSKKSKSRNKPESSPLIERHWFLESVAITLVTFGALFAICVLNVQLQIMYPEQAFLQGSLLGPVGRLVGTLASGFFGWVSILPAFGALLVALHLWMAVREEVSVSFAGNSRGVFAVGILGILLSATVLAHALFGPSGGGVIGEAIGGPLVLLFNTTGASIIGGAVLLVSFAFTTQSNTLDVVLVLVETGKRLALLAFWTVPKVLFYSLVDLLFLSYSALVLVYSWVVNKLYSAFSKGESEFSLEEELADLPRPRRRNNRVPEVEIEAPIDDDFTHVVVNRRQQTSRASKKLLKKAKRQQEKQIEEYVQVGFPPYTAPDVSLLTQGEPGVSGEDDDTLRGKSRVIESKLKDFGILGRVTHVHPGPVITLFEFEPAAGVKVGKIASLQDDLAMSLRALSIRIIAPIPQRGTVGIEVPNTHRDIVRLRDCLESESFVTANSSLSVPIGKDTYGSPVVSNIASMPHLLVAGATGTGKSVFINSLLVSLLYRASPAELGLILIDPKILELSVYDGIPHLRVPVVTVPRQAKAVLEWAVQEMERRYRLMHKYGVRSIDGFNEVAQGEEPSDPNMNAGLLDDVVELTDDHVVAEGTADIESDDPDKPDFTGVEVIQPLPKIVIVIDELADLMLTVGRDIEELITRLAQKARAAGIHLIVATQRPSVDVITGLIKANFPARISFRVSSRIDSRTILDGMGAERLLGKGDMLFMRPGAQHVQRIHGAFLSDREVTRVISEVKQHSAPQYDPAIIAACEKALEEASSEGSSGSSVGDDEYDEFYDKAVELVVEKGKASTSMIQRYFRIGYNRAARIIETMERDGVIGAMDGAKPRQVLVGGFDEDEQLAE